jgi:hypothetical protein
MGRGIVTTTTFFLTAALMEAFLIGFDFIADWMPGELWLFTLLLVIPVWPITAPLELATGFPLEVMHRIQNVLASIFWGLVVSAFVYMALSVPRRKLPA